MWITKPIEGIYHPGAHLILIIIKSLCDDYQGKRQRVLMRGSWPPELAYTFCNWACSWTLVLNHSLFRVVHACLLERWDGGCQHYASVLLMGLWNPLTAFAWCELLRGRLYKRVPSELGDVPHGGGLKLQLCGPTIPDSFGPVVLRISKLDQNCKDFVSSASVILRCRYTGSRYFQLLIQVLSKNPDFYPRQMNVLLPCDVGLGEMKLMFSLHNAQPKLETFTWAFDVHKIRYLGFSGFCNNVYWTILAIN